MALRSPYLDFVNRIGGHVHPADILGRFLPPEIGCTLDQELAKGIQDSQLLNTFLDPEEGSHLVDFQEDIFACRRDDDVETSKHQAQVRHDAPARIREGAWQI